MEIGRKAGFSDMEIGKWIKEALDRAGYSRMQASRILPDTAKYKPRGNPHVQGQQISNKTLQTKPVVTNTSLPLSSTTIAKLEERQRPGVWNEGGEKDPSDYDIKRWDEYDPERRRKIFEWNHYAREDFIKEGFKWQTRFDEMQRENKELKDLTENLRTQIKDLKKDLKAVLKEHAPYDRGHPTYDQQVDALLRHFKLCHVCFLSESERQDSKTKKWAPKYVEGVYDRGIKTSHGYEFDGGWVCAKHREDLAYLKQTKTKEDIL